MDTYRFEIDFMYILINSQSLSCFTGRSPNGDMSTPWNNGHTSERTPRAGLSPVAVAPFSPVSASLWSGLASYRSVVTGCGNFYRARSPLYRNEILQVNMRWKALAEICLCRISLRIYSLQRSPKLLKTVFV